MSSPEESSAGEAAPAAVLQNALRLLASAQRQLRVSVAAEVGIGVSELTALEAVGEMSDVTPKMIALELSLTTGSVTALIDRLVAADLLTRAPNPEDRRSVLLRLTEAGSALLARAAERYDVVTAAVVRSSPGLLGTGIAEDLARAAAVITAQTIR